jgi:hypothetical protein
MMLTIRYLPCMLATVGATCAAPFLSNFLQTLGYAAPLLFHLFRALALVQIG